MQDQQSARCSMCQEYIDLFLTSESISQVADRDTGNQAALSVLGVHEEYTIVCACDLI